MPPKRLTLPELEAHLWGAANLLRGSVDSGDYKHYIFALLFYRRLCDVWIDEFRGLVAEFKGDLARASDPDEHRFHLPWGCLWGEEPRPMPDPPPRDANGTPLKPWLRAYSENIGERLTAALEAIQDANPKLQGVFGEVDFGNKERFPDQLLESLLHHFERIRMGRDDVDPRVLGEAYEYLIERFADDAGKKGGEFATPKQVVKLMVEIVAPEEGMTVYDPSCGWGGILVDAVHFMERHGLNPNSIALFGQERNLNTWAIAKMSMFLHGIEDAEIRRGDTLRDPKHLVDVDTVAGRARRQTGETLLVPRRFDVVLANPPFSLEGWGHELWSKGDRFGRIPEGSDGKPLCPPKSYGEYAFILHMIASLKDRPAPGDSFARTGRMAVVVPHGVLFRGGAEGKLRSWMVEQDLLEAVVGLGPNLFYGTGIPAAVLYLNRMKAPERKGKVLVVNGGGEIVEGKNQNRLSDANVARLAEAVRRFGDEERFCRVVPLAELRKNDHTLNIARYVDLSEEEEAVDLGAEVRALRTALTERDAAEAEMWRVLGELGLGEA